MVDWRKKDIPDAIARIGGSENCPNCGAPISSERCSYCGSVFVDFACMDADKPFYIKIKRGDDVHILKVRLNSVNVTNNTVETYGDPFCVIQSVAYRELDMNFSIL